MPPMQGDYAIQLGVHNALSKAELAHYFKDRDYGIRPLGEDRDFVILRTDADESPSTIMRKLGGLIRIIKIVTRRQTSKLGKGAVQALNELLDQEFFETEKLGLSLFQFGSNSRAIREKVLEESLKPWLKKHKVRPKMVTPTSKRGYNLTPMQVSRKKLMQNGTELVLVKIGPSIIAGITEAITNPKEVIKRDTHRPFTLVTHGSSVRFARMLVNMAGVDKGSRVLDPFCGTGTILQEALLRGAEVAIGLDIEPKCVRGTQKNLESAAKVFKFKGRWEVGEGNAKAILDHLSPSSVDAVVTEPYMGPFLKKLPTDFEAQKIIKSLTPLYQSFLRGANRALVPGGRVVFVTPRFITERGNEYGFIISHLTRRTDLSLVPQVRDNFDPLQPYPYGRENNKIGRDVWVLYKRLELKA